MKKVTFVKSRVKSIFHAESHLGGVGERGAPNAVMNGCTLPESGGAFSQHFPHGAKTSAHIFGAKIARSSRHGISSEFRIVKSERLAGKRRSWESFGYPFVF